MAAAKAERVYMSRDPGLVGQIVSAYGWYDFDRWARVKVVAKAEKANGFYCYWVERVVDLPV